MTTCADSLASPAPALVVPVPVSVLAMLVPPTPSMLEQLGEVNRLILAQPQAAIATKHLLHGGMYARTIRLEPETKMMGSLIRQPTMLIVQGDCSVLAGDARIELTGYNVIPGCAGRKQLFWTHGPVEMTMIFPTSAKTVEEAEDEVFAEAGQLMSRKNGSADQITITGQ